MKHKIAVYRKEHFNAAHRLHNPEWSEERNRETFGKCNNPNFHGHNYELVLKVVGFPDPATGYLVDMKMLSDIMKKSVISKLDHRNLNLDVEEFKNMNPTAENIAMVIYDIIRPQLAEELDLFVYLYETEKNWVSYPEL